MASLREVEGVLSFEARERERDCSERISCRLARVEAAILDRRVESRACRSSIVGFRVASVDGGVGGGSGLEEEEEVVVVVEVDGPSGSSGWFRAAFAFAFNLVGAVEGGRSVSAEIPCDAVVDEDDSATFTSGVASS